MRRLHSALASLLPPAAFKGHAESSLVIYTLSCHAAMPLMGGSGINGFQRHSTSNSNKHNRADLPLTLEVLNNEEAKREKAAAYQRQKEERRQSQQEAGQAGHHHSSGKANPTESRALADQGSFIGGDLLPPSSILTSAAYTSAVERRIQEGIEAGALDNLKGRGQPLPHNHDEQFFRVDPLTAAVGRAMGAQKIRPRSLDLRDELEAEEKVFETAVRDAAERLMARGMRALRGLASRSAQSFSFQLTAAEASSIAAQLEQDAGLSSLHADLASATRAYNTAVLGDKEMYGAAWPLEPKRLIGYRDWCEAVLTAG